MHVSALRFLSLVAASFCSFILMCGPGLARGNSMLEENASNRNSPSYTRSLDTNVVIHGDFTATVDKTIRIKVLRESAISEAGQQELSYDESVDPLEILEAYTEKADGRRIEVDPLNILTRDAATGLDAVYERDAKVKTIIYSDIEVGDSIVYRLQSQLLGRNFPGYFYMRAFLPGSVPYGDFRLTVNVPPGLPLNASIKGEGLTQESAETAEGGRRLVFTYRPPVWAPEEPGAVASTDRDPQIVLTTYNDMKVLGSSYWASMGGKDIVTPEVQALAETITSGIQDKRAQADAIDRWVKKNIRYVLVGLGSGGITPNTAPRVLKNRYGDCKDHVVLMGALLKAKGILSEPALINLGNMYKLPVLPIPFFDHVILYLPGLDLYDDPTAATGGFGVLSPDGYDKPVLHLSEAGGRLAKTPAMKPEEHISTAKTFAFVGMDGAVHGETRQIATGIFASSSRSAALDMQKQGRSRYAEIVLRSLKHPGTGAFDPAIPSDFAEPYAIHGTFKLSDKLETPLTGSHDIPVGIPLHAQPIGWFFGPRVAGRKTDFICYAGKEVQDVEITFADGLPLPAKPAAIEASDKYFSYRAESTMEGRTLRIRREFQSFVTGQVCGPSVENEIAPLLQRVARDLKAQMSFGSLRTASQTPPPDLD